ncbi:hypothetical protein [Dinghuibacter silviterrae]|uniref:Uncharacterized protein n=1 Tax=Dinghuibacter silviterrae TaxID=1539049 RepID=A0A4R8DFZ9_9BACT|nr:hypothetical protein [Dinghuibacter silviterrae]TDW96541.1 hypothetical protein EDB95_4372 [Dinghuibacter silviterrae]
MKHHFNLLLGLSVLILTAGCSKNPLTSSVGLTKGAKAGFVSNADWQAPSATGRVIRYDIGDGHGSDCLFTYDIGNGHVTLTQVSGTNSTTIYSGTGIPTLNAGTISVSQYNTDCTDNFNELGGVHIIPYDAIGNGHEDHLLLYIPGRGILYLLQYNGNGEWEEDWHSTTGIGGYDLAGATKTDKIIAYDYGSGYKNALICYRPGNGYCWVIENTNVVTAPIWTAVVKGSSGIGGFDLKGTSDQIIAEDYNPGAMDLVCYRPGYGYLWYLTHSANSTNFTATYTTRSGFNNFNFEDYQDRVFASNISGSTAANADNTLFCYRPGGGNVTVVDAVSGNTVSGGAPPGGFYYYPFSYNPYGSPYTYIGDHMLNFAGNGYGNSSLLCYSNGGGSSQVYEYSPQTQNYTQVY